MDNPSADDRSTAPPYAAWSSFDALLQRASREDVPARVDKSLLQAWGIAAGNESGMVTSLRALGLIDRSGRPTSDFRAVRLSAPRRREALQRAFLRAYPGLAYDLEPPISDDELHDYFVDERGLTGQMVQKATRFYRHLAEAARGPASPEERAPVAPRHDNAGRKGIASPRTWGQSIEGEVDLTSPEERPEEPPSASSIETEVGTVSIDDADETDDEIFLPPTTGFASSRSADESSGRLHPVGEIPASPGAAAIVVSPAPTLAVNLSVAVPLGATEAELEALFRRMKRAWDKAFGEEREG